MPKPPETRAASTPWPLWPLQLRTEGAHEEGGIRDWSINSMKFTGDEQGNVKPASPGPRWSTAQVRGHRRLRVHILEVDLVLLAMGFLGPVRSGMIEKLGLAVDNRGNVAANADYMTSVDGVFAAGDMRRGQSLVVWAISEGRKAAAAIDKYLSAEGAATSGALHAGAMPSRA